MSYIVTSTQQTKTFTKRENSQFKARPVICQREASGIFRLSGTTLPHGEAAHIPTCVNSCFKAVTEGIKTLFLQQVSIICGTFVCLHASVEYKYRCNDKNLVFIR